MVSLDHHALPINLDLLACIGINTVIKSGVIIRVILAAFRKEWLSHLF
jgi:hypothetical protein